MSRLMVSSGVADDSVAGTLLALANQYVRTSRRSPLQRPERWDAIEEVEHASMFFQRDVRETSTQWWGAMLVRMIMEYLLDNGRFRRDDFDAARAMLEEESQKVAFIPY